MNVLKYALCTSILGVTMSVKTAKPTLDLVEIKSLSPNIVLDMRYATTNNFTKEQVYDDSRCFVRKATAEKICKVQQELEAMGLRLKVWDAYRPRCAQYKFWELIPDPRFVADPKKGSRHNLGASIDCTLVDKNGNELEMPSEFDDFCKKAYRNYDSMTPEAAKNCKLLETLMVKHGFSFFHNEWWHFDDVDWKQYELLDIPISEL